MEDGARTGHGSRCSRADEAEACDREGFVSLAQKVRSPFAIFGLYVSVHTSFAFSRRGPDRVTEELATVLSQKASFEFKALFTIVHASLKARNQASGGEEMLRLRAYEKLQNLVQAGIVKKTGKEYRGVSAALVTFMETTATLNAKFAAGVHSRPPAHLAEAAAPAPVSTKKPALSSGRTRRSGNQSVKIAHG